MGTLFDIFMRDRSSANAEAGQKNVEAVRLDSGRMDDSSFRGLAEIQQSIDYSVAAVIQGFSGLQEFADRIAAVRGELSQTFEEHRRLALANSVLVQERDHFQEKFVESAALADSMSKVASELDNRVAELSRDLEKHISSVGELEQRNHLLSVAKKEVDEISAETTRQLQVAQDTIDSLRLEVDLFRQRAEADAVQISEMAARLKLASEETILLSNRCETFEAAIRIHEEEIAELREQNEGLAVEAKAGNQLAFEREAEAAKHRTELSKLFDRYQLEGKERDRENASLKGEIARMSASLKMLEQVNGDLKLENEKLVVQVRQLQENTDRNEVAISRLETKNARLSVNLEAALDAKKQIDQSRLAMSTRLDALGQILRDREIENKKLENEVNRLSSELDEKSSSSQDIIESLKFKVFELEKEISSQNNEKQFMAAQIEAAKRA